MMHSEMKMILKSHNSSGRYRKKMGICSK